MAIAEAPARAAAQLLDLPLDLVDVGTNVRVDAGELAELAASIRELGVLQPVRAIGPGAGGRYRLVWGQRRYLASLLAEKTTIPAFVEASADVNAPGPRRSIEQLVENLQRKDLNAIEEAIALREVLDGDTGLTQAALAQQLGRSPSWLANTLGILKAPTAIQDGIRAGALTVGHAKALSGLPAKDAERLAKAAIKDGTSAHELEREAKWQRDAADRQAASKAKSEKNAAKAVAELKNLGYPAGATVYSNSWGQDSTVLQKAIQAAGWKFSTAWTGAKPGKACDCQGRHVEIGWSDKVVIRLVCHVRTHVESKEAAERERRDAKANEARRLRALLHDALAGHPGIASIDRAVGALAAWRLLGDYGRGQLGDTPAKQWAAIVAMPASEIADTVVRELVRGTESWNQDAPMAAMLAALGVVVETVAVPIKAKKARA